MYVICRKIVNDVTWFDDGKVYLILLHDHSTDSYVFLTRQLTRIFRSTKQDF